MRGRKKVKGASGFDAPSIEVVDAGHGDDGVKKPNEKAMDKRLKLILMVIAATAVVFVFGLVIPKDLFNFSLQHAGYRDGYTLSWFIDDFSENVSGLFAVLTGNFDQSPATVNTMITYCVIILCGAGLALCGAVYQGVFKNALVSPSSLGVMSGAGLGMALWVVFFFNADESHGLWFETGASTDFNPLASLWSSYSLALTSFVGCVVVVGLVVLVIGTVGRGSTSGLMMIITGQVIGSIMGAVSSSIRYYYVTVDPEGPQAEMMMELQISSFYRVYSWVDLVAVGIPVLVMFLVVMHYRNQLMLLAFSEGEARAMGVETKKMRFLIIGLATLVTAIVVSFCGRVGFVGFMLPLLARRVVGPNFTYLMPLSMVGGGVFVLAAYVLVTMTLGATYATMSGVFISIAGAVVFLVTAIRGVGEKRGAF